MVPLPFHHIDYDALSGIAGSISIACWIIVFTPQLFENFQRQSAEGLSLTFINLWLAGDVFNVIGAVLQGVLPTMTILAVYYTVADIILLLQCLVYNSRNNSKQPYKPVDPKHLSPATPLLDDEQVHHYGTQYPDEQDAETARANGGGGGGDAANNEPGQDDTPLPRWKRNMYHSLIVVSVLLSGVIGWWFSGDDGSGDDDAPQDFNFWGQVFGWLCAVFYLGSRIPQLLLNYQRKSCEGISFLFFLFACLGNVAYVISILAKDLTMHYLAINASWLAGSLLTLALDFAIFIQFWVYNSNDV